MLDYLQVIGVKKWQLQPIFGFGRTRDAANLQLSLHEYLAMGRFIHDRHAEARGKGVEIFGADGVGYFSALDPPSPFPWRGCSAGISTCGIMSDGRLKGCLSWTDTMVEGNLRQDKFWNIWFGDGVFPHTRSLKKKDMTGQCRECDKAMECGGGCTTMSLASTGRIHSSPYCLKAILAGSASTSVHYGDTRSVES